MVREMVPQDGEQADQAPLVPGQLLADLDKPGETVVVALGGRGGMGDSQQLSRLFLRSFALLRLMYCVCAPRQQHGQAP